MSWAPAALICCVPVLDSQPGAGFLLCWMCPLHLGDTLHPTASLDAKANVAGCLNTAFPRAFAPWLPPLEKNASKNKQILQRDFYHNLSVVQEALRRCRNSCMKPFFCLEGLASPGFPARPHLGGSGLSSQRCSQPSAQTHPPSSSEPLF